MQKLLYRERKEEAITQKIEVGQFPQQWCVSIWPTNASTTTTATATAAATQQQHQQQDPLLIVICNAHNNKP